MADEELQKALDHENVGAMRPDVELAFDIIKNALSRGFKFNNAQKDMLVNISIDEAIPEGQKSLFLESAEAHGVPLWMVLWAQWVRSTEWAVAYDLILDSNWEQFR